jgi:hypothetical protein
MNLQYLWKALKFVAHIYTLQPVIVTAPCPRVLNTGNNLFSSNSNSKSLGNDPQSHPNYLGSETPTWREELVPVGLRFSPYFTEKSWVLGRVLKQVPLFLSRLNLLLLGEVLSISPQNTIIIITHITTLRCRVCICILSRDSPQLPLYQIMSI